MGLLEAAGIRLDDRKYDELTGEARLLIARYSQLWTDHNIHDPGITFIELFAWLAEMQMYQLDRITEANYRKFLKLVDGEPRPASPALVDVTFEVPAEEPVSPGEKVSTKIDGETVFFEVEEDALLSPLTLEKALTVSGSVATDNGKAIGKGVPFAAFGASPGAGDELRLEFKGAFSGKELRLAICLYEGDLPAPGRHADESAEAYLPVSLEWEYYGNGAWNKATVAGDTTNGLTKGGKVTLAGLPPTKNDDVTKVRCRVAGGHYEIPPMIHRILLNTVRLAQVEIVHEECPDSTGKPDQRIRLKKCEAADRPFVLTSTPDFPLFNAMDVLSWQGLLLDMRSALTAPRKRIWDALPESARAPISAWGGTGEPDKGLKEAVLSALNGLLGQRDLYDAAAFEKEGREDAIGTYAGRQYLMPEAQVRVFNRLLIQAAYREELSGGRPVVQVEDGTGEWKTWIEVGDFEASCPGDPHYTLNADEGEVAFGNGLNGSIPPRGRKVRVRQYAVTRGPKGNVRAGQAFRLEGSMNIPGTNAEDASGGKAPETLAQAKGRALEDFNTMIYRAVTLDDYEKLTLDTPGLRVNRAHAIAGFDPDYPCADMPGNVTVVVVPYARENSFPPAPGEEFIGAVLSHLEGHRLITARTHVAGPKYTRISMQCKVRLKKYSDPKAVKARIDSGLARFLDPICRGPGEAGWPFGRSVYPSEVYRLIDGVEGVDYAIDVALSADGGPFTKDAIPLSGNGLVYPGEHDIEII